MLLILTILTNLTIQFSRLCRLNVNGKFVMGHHTDKQWKTAADRERETAETENDI